MRLKDNRVLDCHVAALLAMTEMPLLQAMASGVIARYEAIQRADNRQITKHVTGRHEDIPHIPYTVYFPLPAWRSIYTVYFPLPRGETHTLCIFLSTTCGETYTLCIFPPAPRGGKIALFFSARTSQFQSIRSIR
ncbi:MAG: hypothetical protein LBF85_00680 [Tannerella sp.]|nr:hypothetical protein [Tannerella sp.]